MSEAEEDRRTRELLADLERRPNLACAACERPLCAHAYVLNVALGYRNAPHCVDCLAHGFQKPRAALLEHLLDWVEARLCYSTGWSWAGKEEGFDGQRRPPCLWGAETTAAAATATEEVRPGPVPHDAEWNAGAMGCGDLVLELRSRMKDLSPGQVLRLTATDPGAPTDLPAWSRLTGNRLAGQDHPRYWIEKGS
ncbi:MAG: sulfurtransferase TusA family protein [Planctomycetota bacterium]|jgi:tRNA 2-thiouridine synthesizing protein A